MANINLNENQKRAISSNAKNILVSASAGTGKTFVMVERIVDIIINKKTPIEKFLVVTFAKASAEEMKERIFNRLYDNIEESPFVKEQIKKLQSASISTMDSFCSDLIRRYFYAIDIQPKFSIIDETKSALMMKNAMEELIEDKYQEKDLPFLRLVDIFNVSRKDQGLTDIIFELYKFSRSLPNPREFLENQAVINFDKPQVFENIFVENINNELKYSQGEIVEFQREMITPTLDMDKAFLENLWEYLEAIIKCKNLPEKVELIANITFSRLNTNKGKFEIFETELHEKIQKFKARLTKSLAKKATLSKIIGNTQYVEDVKKDAVALCGLAVEFSDRYKAEKSKKGLMDFSDLIHNTLTLLENPEIRKDVQDSYDYVFVDEYQDTSKVQEALILTISTKNLFMVGDIKQSIYGFRQCDKNIFATKEKNYHKGENGEVIYLNQNFRSFGKILKFVNLVYKNVMTADVGDDYLKNSMFDVMSDEGSVDISLVAVSGAKEVVEPKIYSVMEDKFKDEELVANEMEGHLIANKIQGLVGTTFFDGKVERKIKYSDFCILLRAVSGSHGEAIYKTLQDCGIPTTITSSGNSIGDHKEVLQVLNFIYILQNYKDDVPLLSVLKSPFFSFTDSELIKIRKNSKKKFFFECLADYAGILIDGGGDNSSNTNYKTSSENAITNQAVENQDLSKNAITNQSFTKETAFENSNELFVKVNEFFAMRDYYRKVAMASGGVHALGRAVEETPFEMLTAAEVYGGEKIKRVKKFLDLINSLEDNNNLVELVDNLKKMKDQLKLNDSDGGNDVVRIMTIHKSKGLEFPICFVSGIHKKLNLKDSTKKILCHSDFGLSMNYYNENRKVKNKILSYFTLSEILVKETIQEELRMLYVALTRAKTKLILTGWVKDNDCEVSGLDKLNIKQIKSKEDFYQCRSYLDFVVGGIIHEENKIANVNIVREDIEKEQKKTVELSLSSVDENAKHALDCNLHYQYPYLVDTKTPTKFSASSLKREGLVEEEVSYVIQSKFNEEASKVGSAYHKVLELAKPLATLEQVKSVLLQAGENELIQPEYLSKVDADTVYRTLNLPFMNFGTATTEQSFMGYFKGERFTAHQTEKRVLIQGVLDLMLVNKEKNQCILVDYKYSSAKNIEVLKERYSQQMDIYSYAIENILKIKIEKIYIVNVRTGEFIEI